MGNQAAQLIHAAGESSPGGLSAGTYAVALHAKNESDLMKLAEKLQTAGIPTYLIVESDEPHSGQVMAIGIPPMDRTKLRKFLSSYPLVK